MRSALLVTVFLMLSAGSAQARVTVEWVGSNATGADVQVGDIMSSWRIGDTEGVLASASSLWRALNETGAARSVILVGRRGDTPKKWELRAGVRDVHAFADVPQAPWSEVRALARALATDDTAVDNLVDAFVEANAPEAGPSASAGLIADLLVIVLLESAQRGDAALRVLARRDGAPANTTVADLNWRWRRGKSLVRGGELDKADSLLEGTGDAGASPGGALAMARIGHLRGVIGVQRGDLAQGERHFRDVLDRLAVVAPASMVAADALRGLGTVSAMRGDMGGAEAFYTDALALTLRIGDDGGRARVLNNLGIVAVRRGDIAGAERYYQQALALNERLGRWPSYSINLFNLADLASARGDPDSAIALLNRAEARFALDEPDGLRMLQTQVALAGQYLTVARLDDADALYQLALEGYRLRAPGNEQVSEVHLGLGEVALQRGRADQALAQFERALAQRETASPGALPVAEARRYLAQAHVARGELDLAQAQLVAARAIYQSRAPTRSDHAQTLHALAEIQAARGDADAVITTLSEAMDVLDAQTVQLGGGDDARALFADRHAPIYKMRIEALVEAGKHADAFNALERYRSRSMLALLARREQSFAAALDASAAALRALDVQYDALQRALAVEVATGASVDVLDKLREQQVELRARRDGLRQINTAPVPEAASSTRIGLNAVARDLPDDTLLVSFSVGESRTLVFAVADHSLSVHPVPIGRNALSEQVARLRALIAAGRGDAVPSAALRDVGAELYDALIAPAARRTAARRLLVVPDGPLHQLPFAALTMRNGASERYLVEAWDVRRALSLTLLDRLSPCAPGAATCEQSGGLAPERVVAFAAPNAGAVSLPFASREVDALATIFGEALTRFDGAAATEARVFESAGEASVLHFATHGTLSPGLPLDTALALTPAPPRDNGKLQVWEIFERLRTDASLVVLSACDSASGLATDGDGMIGLARAFHFAGAPSVVATQWAVSDRATATLMTTFYEAVSAGNFLDAALADAQRAMLSGPKRGRGLRSLLGDRDALPPQTAAPYYWAGFELSGAP